MGIPSATSSSRTAGGPFSCCPSGETPAGGGGRVCDDCARVWDLSSDGKHFVFGFDSGSQSMSLVLYDLVSRRKTALVKAPDRNLARARFSPDDTRISFVQHVPGSGRSRVYVIPFAEGTVSSPDQWIAVTDDQSFYDKPVWSPDANLLYLTSDRDGFRCIWAQRLDPKTRRPVGPLLPIHHSHSARRSLLNANIIPLELHVAPGRLLFTSARSPATSGWWNGRRAERGRAHDRRHAHAPAPETCTQVPRMSPSSVARCVDLAHPARTDGRQDPVRADVRALGKRHGARLIPRQDPSFDHGAARRIGFRDLRATVKIAADTDPEKPARTPHAF